jgi:hypothetical protein
MSTKIYPDSSNNDDDDSDSDKDSIPSVSTVDEEKEEDEAEIETKATEVSEADSSYGGKRAAARDNEARMALRAWRDRPEAKHKEDLSEKKWPCYDVRWFFGCCINYPVEDAIILGDIDLVIKAVKLCKKKYPDTWQARLNRTLKNYGEHTVTSLAILEGRQDIAEWLCENGIDIDQRDGKTGLAPLHHAIRQDCLTDQFKSTIELLVESSCEIDIRDQVRVACLFSPFFATCFHHMFPLSFPPHSEVPRR